MLPASPTTEQRLLVARTCPTNPLALRSAVAMLKIAIERPTTRRILMSSWSEK